MSARKLIKATLLILHKLVASLLLPVPASIRFDSIHKILIYATIGIGDMIMFTPALRAIRQRFPTAHITIIVSHSECEDVIRGSNLIDEIMYLEPSHWKTVALSYRVKKRHYDLLISSYLCRSIYLNNLTLLSGIPYRAGHSSSSEWKSDNDYLFNIQAPVKSGIHESKKGWLLAEAVQCKHVDNRPFFYINKESEYFADQFFIKHHLTGKWVIAVQVGTVESQLWKQWSLTKLAEVCDRLLANDQIKIIIFGSARHKQALEEVLVHMNKKPIVVAGQTSLKQSAALISKCQATLCNDSGIMHISSSVGTPVIAIFGPTDARWTGPMGSGHTIIRKDIQCSPCYKDMSLSGETALNCDHHNCLNMISVDEVLSTIAELRDSDEQL